MFSLFKRREAQRVYCQNCGKDITDRGGDVTSNDRVYCHGYKSLGVRCIDEALIKGHFDFLFANYLSPQQVQRAIRKGKLTYFNPLEESASN